GWSRRSCSARWKSGTAPPARRSCWPARAWRDSSWRMRPSGQVRAARPPLVAEAARARIEVSDYERTTAYETCDTDRRVLSHDSMLQLQSADDAEPRARHLSG